jgi:hypothetical protein
MTKIEDVKIPEAQQMIDRFMSKTKDLSLYQKGEKMYQATVRHQRLVSALHRAGKVDNPLFTFKVYVVDEYVKAFAMRLRETACEA